MTLHADRVSWDRGGTLVVDGVSVRPEQGHTVGLLGPNGSGKSSLLRLLSGYVTPTSGVVELDGQDIAGLRRRTVARRVAVVAQQVDTDVDLTIGAIVRLGRLPHRGTFGADRAVDDAAVAAALAQTGLVEMADRLWHKLSGGEKQRVQIARALAQEPRELLLDEPTNHLDIHHQLELMSLIARLPVTSIVAIHDLNLAAMFCDHVMVLQNGRVVAAGTPREVLTAELIGEVYRVRAHVIQTPTGLNIQFLPNDRGVSE
ncbi:MULTISPECIES: ABC transporter ATP-binding protein [Mycobacteriaceae]|uniref:Histidinol-phosphatase n=1 Tax=Mycolicibacterium neoaurum VKM Ac-1815D TaxID=700508 RepID=V5XAM4_MYCNE|nr:MULTISPECIES: ABC transporter ATP-binding protein [Mycobacteriaceae]AHC24464.1 histidinol phosphatase [Mycolicibacterium neoaurum VKM Ac-1815D]AMO05053.1 histidinol phosphatase [Mycolicibacterium neoaurum]AXK76634.1 ABC transporter ATP-binding protein [Mycolicibacterium neoaurum]KJQ52146.1 histidinol phosphatase [Mycolicibacterium neoaurum]KUM07774.1 histidinol phosphatase [Mycolicibacterium neoaurum]